MNKHEIQAELAQRTQSGGIVEIGVGAGQGTLSLARGTAAGRKLPIYCIDEFVVGVDVLGGWTGTERRLDFLRMVTESGHAHRIHLVELDPFVAARACTTPVGFLWIDRSLGIEDLRSVLDAWMEHLLPGAMVGLAGSEYAGVGAAELAAEQARSGRFARLDEPGFETVAVIQKLPPHRTAFWIASGGRFIEEAARSATSVKRHLGVQTALFYATARPEGTTAEPFDMLIKLPPRQHDFWYLDSVHYFVGAVNYLAGLISIDGATYKTPAEQLLYLDTDTMICCPEANDIWSLLDRYDLALGQSPQRDAIESAVGTPSSFTTLSIGVNAFRNTARTRALFVDWLNRYQRNAAQYDDNDQAPLRDALWENIHDVRWTTLAPEYALRFDFGCWVVGRVRILHGRPGGGGGPLEPVCTEINSTYRMRLWNHGLVPPSE